MSRLSEIREQEELLKRKLAELDALKNSDEFKNELEFENKLRALLEKYGFSLKNIVAILDPKATLVRAGREASAGSQRGGGTRKPRNVKQYKNPHNGEVIETKGGNHKLLKEWKAQYGGDTVEAWATTLSN
ncbi:histone-like nucleoid-structuring protein, MvaT/MvaU family [Pseudomonas putida]|uniref:DNA binding protein n=1 Tax=Pseudomonas putida TaxID=303 RepID=A0A8I1JHW1_PSEPU|nr:histone-like nucleoid-structuring protein, MvaT/MvaU family [Pseudomonas putida]MBI6882338.1 DNA binding protein [Pseudomonas putida]